MPCQTPHLDESSSAVPGLSPGVVADHEWLLRSIFYSDDIVDGVVQNTAISLDDLRERGYSVNRQHYVSRGVIESGIAKYLQKPFNGIPREYLGIACFKTSTVRDIVSNDSQAFVVIDAAEPDNPGHAAIYAANPSIPDSKARQLRSLLFPLLCSPVSLEQALSM